MPPLGRDHKKVSSDAFKALVDEFEETTALTSDGNVSFLSAGSDELFHMLPDAFSWTPDLSRREVRSILRSSLIACRKTGAIKEAEILGKAQDLACARLAEKPRRFSVWTKFRAQQMPLRSNFSLKYRSVRLRSAKVLPKYMRIDSYFISGFGDVDPNDPSFFGHLIMQCDARNEEAGMTRMLDSAQIFMGVANIFALHQHWGRTVSRRVADGKLWLGPYQFAFCNRRFVGRERVWYNPDYDEDAWRVFPLEMAQILRLMPRVRRALALLEQHPLRTVLERVIKLVQDGMAATDGSLRLLRYWSALENLYSDPSGRQRDYEKVIRRAAFAEPDRLLAKWKLRHLAHLRNEYVHSGTSENDLHAMCQYVRNLLSRHVIYLIHNGGFLSDHQHLLDWVDLPGEEGRLVKMREMIERRLFMEEEGHRERQHIENA